MRRCSSDAKLQFISSYSVIRRPYFSSYSPQSCGLSEAPFSTGYGFQSIFLCSRFSGTLLPDETPGFIDTPSTNVSSHIFEVLCIRFVIVIQYEKSILYTFDTFSETSHLFSEVLFTRFHLQVLSLWNVYSSAFYPFDNAFQIDIW